LYASRNLKEMQKRNLLKLFIIDSDLKMHLRQSLSVSENFLLALTLLLHRAVADIF
jgi:hypothetical protein